MKQFKATMDGNEAAAYVSYAFTEVAAMYPITPSSTMAEHVDQWVAEGRKNLFGQTVRLIEMESECGAAGALHGAMETGALVTSYTSSQGLLLMVPAMFRMSGYLRAGVLHVAARSVASNAYSISAEHSDVMACRQTGFAMLASGSVQEVMDLGAVAHLSTIRGRLPFLHFFDGFRTSHEIQKIDCLPYEDLARLVDYNALREYRKSGLNPEYPIVRTPGENTDVYFQNREACNPYYDALPDIVSDYMKVISEETGRKYDLFVYHGAPDAKHVIVAMGSVSGTIQETVDELSRRGEKVGFLHVHLYRPFSARHFLAALPDTVETISVLDRTKEPGAAGEPLYQDVCTVVSESERRCRVLSGRYGLGGKDTTPEQIVSVFRNAAEKKPKNHFTIGIVDDVTFTSLPAAEPIDTTPKGTVCLKFWGFGSDGTVGANKNTIKIIGDHTDKKVQAFFQYDSKKSGGVTISHLRFGDRDINSTYFVTKADFVACHNQSYIHKYEMVQDLRPGGAFLLNCAWTDEELDAMLPAAFKRYAAKNHIRLYTIDAGKIARELKMGRFINAILQAAFFRVTNIIPLDDAISYMKTSIRETYGRKGEEIVQKNCAAVERGAREVHEVAVPAEWAQAQDPEPQVGEKKDVPAFIRTHMIPVYAQKGNDLPVSAFRDMPDSSMPVGTSKYEKPGVAEFVPMWKSDCCIQCNQCSLVCPHGVIRPILLTPEESAAAPETYETIPANGKDLDGYRFRLQVSVLDCTGCGSCANICPAKNKALEMKPLTTQSREIANWEFTAALPHRHSPIGTNTVRGSQFEQPLLEFNCACPGCAQTPYVKLITQLFGDRMYVATATGCSSVFATGYPSIPYTTNEFGRGPAYSNSLFENNAEFGLGMALGVEQQRSRLALYAEQLAEKTSDAAIRSALADWLKAFESEIESRRTADALLPLLEASSETGEAGELVRQILENREHLAKKSIWVVGGDGWAYDIGYGGLDHVLSLNANINILVLDTEVYSNTGGQASKASPRGAVTKFAASGIKRAKKDLAEMAMGYENVYVAQIAMGADYNQTLKTIREAEAYPGTSLIIAYCPCIAHGIKGGMGNSQTEMKRAVEAGYWHLFRRNPLLREEGKNPFTLDSAKPTASYEAFLMNETRYASLERTFPANAETLIPLQEQDAEKKYRKYLELSQKTM